MRSNDIKQNMVFDHTSFIFSGIACSVLIRLPSCLFILMGGQLWALMFWKKVLADCRYWGEDANDIEKDFTINLQMSQALYRNRCCIQVAWLWDQGTILVQFRMGIIKWNFAKYNEGLFKLWFGLYGFKLLKVSNKIFGDIKFLYLDINFPHITFAPWFLSPIPSFLY